MLQLLMMPLYCSQGHENHPNNRFCKDCGQQLPLTVGKVLDKRYQIVSHLGQGGFGRTYLAEALHRFHEHCVLKEFAPQVQGTSELEKAKELFEREAGALHQLKHPQLPGFWELFQADMGNGVGCLFLVQDYVEGQTYFDLFKSGKRLSEAEITQLLCQMLPVLSYIHSKGVIHRDIAPDNIILRKSDNLPVLIDFGGVKQIAVTAVSKFTSIGIAETRLGKKGYAPEEQLRRGQVFVNSDLYSLAVTALVLLTGKEPQDLYDTYKGSWQWQEIGVSQQLQAVLQKMLAHKPGDRFASAQEVLKALPSPPPLSLQSQSNSNIAQTQTKAVASKANAMQMRNIPSAFVSRMQTLVFAPKAPPKINLVTPSPITPSPITPNPNNQVIQKPPQFLSKLGAWTFKIAGGIGFILVTGLAGWALIRSVKLDTSTKRSPNAPVISSSSEQQRVEKILSRRKALGIDEAPFNAKVNQRFYTKHPELNGRPLTTKPEDNALRQEWYAIAEKLLF